MLEIESVSWRNFLSYPNTPTTIRISELGLCLITGKVIEEGRTLKRSNGAGKSTIASVIQWVLFGRTMHSAQPGDKIVNYFTKKDCWAKITFKNGDNITRTRNVGGHNELIYVKDGDEHTLVSDTQSTTKIQQAKLTREFNLDWEIFCGSVFFNQYGKSWMEMSDTVRKKALERILHVDKFTFRATAAKKKLDACSNKVESLKNSLEAYQREEIRLSGEIERLKTAKDGFADSQRARQRDLLLEAKDEKSSRDSIKIPDLEDLSKKWDIVAKISDKISELRDKKDTVDSNIRTCKGDVRSAQSRIDLWSEKSGQICSECEQDVPETHTKGKIAPYMAEQSEAQERLKKAIEEQGALDTMIAKAEKLLVERQPAISLHSAKMTKQSWGNHDKELKRLKTLAIGIKDEKNPHVESLGKAEYDFAECQSRIKETKADIESYDLQRRHFKYIYKAYNDRTKIKSYVFQEHIPYINGRLRHYLDIFGLDVRIELTASLGIKSNMWGYDFESGGERKRTDVAFMFAIFDFHEQMYGRQSNLLILDEVDGRLDEDGIDSLISIIKDELAPKVESIMVISHRNLMFDTFPRELQVTRENRVSRIEVS